MEKICQRCGQPFDGGRYSTICKSCLNGTKRRVKVADVFDVDWLPIPCAPKYEIDKAGHVRNIKTGKILKTHLSHGKQCPAISMYVGKRQTKFTIAQLLWITHGKISKKTTIVVPVIINKLNERHYFDSTRAAARFLAEREFYSVSHTRKLFRLRRTEIYGWRINYQR